jgi:CheY-like chemotaxis protein
MDTIHILLADDDKDDCLFFKEALEELKVKALLTLVSDGQQLMQRLKSDSDILPDVLFLDLNMPRKNGMECLAEIKQSEILRELPVIIFSTSYEQEIVNVLYKSGAQHYIRKPNSFSLLAAVIKQALTFIPIPNGRLPITQANFVLTAKTGTVRSTS